MTRWFERLPNGMFAKNISNGLKLWRVPLASFPSSSTTTPPTIASTTTTAGTKTEKPRKNVHQHVPQHIHNNSSNVGDDSILNTTTKSLFSNVFNKSNDNFNNSNNYNTNVLGNNIIIKLPFKIRYHKLNGHPNKVTLIAIHLQAAISSSMTTTSP